MPLRRVETKPSGSFGFYEVGTDDEQKVARDAAAEVAQEAMKRAAQLAEEREAQLAEVVWRTAQRLLDETQALLLQEPAWPEPE